MPPAPRTSKRRPKKSRNKPNEGEFADRTALTVDAMAYEKFLKRLGAPPNPNERLRRTMRTPAPWERG